MSNLNPQQFHEQLPMFLPAKDIVEHFHKIDSSIVATPTAEWGRPGSAYYGRGSLREEKLSEALDPSRPGDIHQGFHEGNIPPLPVGYTPYPKETAHAYTHEKWLMGGHHRLAVAETIHPNYEVPLRWYSSLKDVHESSNRRWRRPDS